MKSDIKYDILNCRQRVISELLKLSKENLVSLAYFKRLKVKLDKYNTFLAKLEKKTINNQK